ncbi:MAG: short-chain dehydrogenase [Armatimonadetes bacterium]|nr:short-chain dehydrogenase [Armatimonadota bacterium]
MNIRTTTVLVLGGGGMVGRAVCRELIEGEPARIVVSSLLEDESRAAIEFLREEYRRTRRLQSGLPPIEFVPEWGNIFVRESMKQMSGRAVLTTPEGRAAIIEDMLAPLTLDILQRFALYQLIMRHRPDVIIDAINTATGIAYGDIFGQARRVWAELREPDGAARESVEHLLCGLYIPQLIRHVDVLYRAMARADTRAYVKLGTSGTGGMGWNIPYTHGEERPSALLLSKSAVAGAHTLLLFLMARTPGILSFKDEDHLVAKRPPATKEIKPTALIGWRGISYGDVLKRGQPVYLEEVSLQDAQPVKTGMQLQLFDPEARKVSDRKLRTVFVDTGENGLFSTEEFVAITSPGQMEFVTPEEIARNVVDEIRGINTGKDVINALNVTCMGPTYRAGFQRERALRRLRQLEQEHGCESIAFENLGPPRLSKLLFEASFLKRIYGTMQGVLEKTAQELSQGCLDLLRERADLVATPVTLGIPILFEEGGELRLLRGREVKTPPPSAGVQVQLEDQSLEDWARAGWIDLRPASMGVWRSRLEQVIADAASISPEDTSSRYVRDREFWIQDDPDGWLIQPGELVAWIFINEDKGMRGRE